MKRLVLISALMCAVWPVAAQRARVDFDHAGDFSQYRTYRWVGPPDMDSFNQLMQERVTGMVEEALASKQLKRVQTGGDLLVGLHMNVQDLPVFTTFTDSTGFGWGAGWGSSVSTTTSQVFQQGTITIDLVDSHRNQLVFQGVSRAAISSKPTRNTRRFAKAVNEIFEKYPPR
jgi:hypothetical protein